MHTQGKILAKITSYPKRKKKKDHNQQQGIENGLNVKISEASIHLCTLERRERIYVIS